MVEISRRMQGQNVKCVTPNLEENMPFRGAKTIVQRTFAGQFTEPRTIAKLLSQRKQTNIAVKICLQGNL